MSGVAPSFPKMQFLSPTGAPLANGSISVYVAGSTTPTNTWKDQALTVLNTNPIALDTRGEALVWLDPAIVYKFVLANAGGSQQWSVDNVFGAEPAGVRAAFAAAGGAALIGFIQSGAGAVARTLEDKNRDTISALDFMTTAQKADVRAGTALLDVTGAIQAAATYAIANGYKKVYLPAGTYLVGATINLGRLALVGDGDGTRLKPTISDGSAVLSLAAGSNLFLLEKFRIDSGIDQTNFISGAINAQNCIGVKIASAAPTYSARFVLRDVFVSGCKTGWDINGFILTADNVWATNCETGFTCTRINSSRLHLRIENCRQDFAISASNGIHMDQLISEGGVLQSGLVSATFDNCSGLTITAPYFEQVRTVPFITFGATTQCNAITMDGMTVGFGDNVGTNYDTFPLAFDKVNGLDISGYFSTGSHHNLYSTTASTKNIVDKSVGASVANWGPHDNSGNLSVVRNHFPNPNFDLWFRGWPTVTATRAVATQETTLVRRGLNALRLTLQAGQANGSFTWLFNDSYLGVKMRGKRACLYAWIWIPNTADYDPAALGAQVVQAYIGIFSDGTGSGTTLSGTHHTVRGAWNLFKIFRDIPADCTRIDVSAFMAMNSGVAAGTEYLVIDSVYLVEGDGQEVAIRNGWVSDSAINQCIGVGGRMIMRSNAAPSDPDMTFEVGDHVQAWTVAAGGSPGWVCTTGGVGGVAVFKAMAAVAA